MRSRTGCLTCRGRKLKCDEEKPICGQCSKAKRECRPCDGVVFRHQQNASMNSADGRNLNSFYAYKNTFDSDSVWLEIPKNVTFVNIQDPYALPSSPELEEDSNEPLPLHDPHDDREVEVEHASYTDLADPHIQGLEALSAAALFMPSETSVLQESLSHPSDDMQNMKSPLADNGLEIGASLSMQAQAPSIPTNSNLDFILNPASTLSPQIDPDLHSLESSHSMADNYRTAGGARAMQAKASTETSHKVAFLQRHFSEVTGRWMDLFDQTTFFSSHIPVKSISNPLLKHAACAYAAKQLGRVGGLQAITGGSFSNRATMEQWDNADNEDWAFLAAQHYDQAISLLMDALNWDYSPSESNTTQEIDKRQYSPRTVEGMVAERKLRRRQFGSAQSTARSDDLLAATAILCEYESLDASTAAWARHLSGTKTLLDVIEVGMMPLDLVLSPEVFTTPSRSRKPSQARRAIFWNFARQDLFAAFVNECRTRLDTDDVAMWRDAGLLLDENALVVPSNTPESDLQENDQMKEDMTGNALIWLMSKMMNLICAGATDDSDFPRNDHFEFAPPSAIDQQSLSEKWDRLNLEMETWYNGLRETFMPSAIISVRPQGADLTEVWHSVPVCAATVLSWHMAQVLMLVNKPHDLPTRRTTVAARVNAFRTIQSEIAYHSRQIVGLCLARPEGSVRIQALQPLFVAGQCLTEEAERKVVLDLLRGIERDLGWATDYRVQQLRQEWGWDQGGMSARGSNTGVEEI
ncbi:MAG: hypothetical protein LQ352_004876 [Teloschistes flavicans]|nr:MAG: hypothetical protein LQ352_004876 [Teloschistes flavicans]